MRRSLVILLMIAMSSPAQAQRPLSPRSLFEHMAGRWVLRGTIDQQQTTHDVDAGFILNRGYVQIHEVSREKDAKGAPAYEAFVTIAVDTATGEFAALWLDNTATGLFMPDGVGRAKASGDSIPFLFGSGQNAFHNTFIYSPSTDSWRWIMDNESNGKLQPFARVTLTKQ